LYVSCLDRAEKILRPDKRHPSWKQFRFEILNLGNDKIRQLDDRISEYAIEFRPEIVFGVKYISDNTCSDIEDRVSNFQFYFYNGQPGIRIELSRSQTNIDLLKNIAESIRCGIVINKDDKKTVWWESWGLAECFSSVIPFFDSNKCFKGKALEDYSNWKEQVYQAEAQGVGNVTETSED
jgi:hypothetical protein